jgi:hypothetical protein
MFSGIRSHKLATGAVMSVASLALAGSMSVSAFAASTNAPVTTTYTDCATFCGTSTSQNIVTPSGVSQRRYAYDITTPDGTTLTSQQRFVTRGGITNGKESFTYSFIPAGGGRTTCTTTAHVVNGNLVQNDPYTCTTTP